MYKGRRGAPSVKALDGIDLDIEEGSTQGLLGPNGAGKTTLVKILSTVLLPTAGSARVLGFDLIADTKKVRRLIGIVLGGDRGLYLRLTGRQNLRYWASLYGVSDRDARIRSERLLKRVGLEDRGDEPVDRYSRGMKQRLHLARGLVGDPRLLFLDEPTIGMDPIAAHEFRTLVTELRIEGRTILLTTHDMAEAEAVCDRVALIDNGRLLAVESPRTLASWVSRYERIDAGGVPDDLLVAVRQIRGVTTVGRAPDGSTRIGLGEEGAGARVLQLLVAGGVTSIRTSLPTLEEVYLELMKERGFRV
ncbi:MAG TPA: ABC transporter ATP-binding protein [Bryobacteraceae bacterium]|nr:ABC transporter ATP-binding protein [Bryobacteraceae bacterium]